MSSTSRPSSTSNDTLFLFILFSLYFSFSGKRKEAAKKSRYRRDRGSLAGNAFVYQTVRDFLSRSRKKKNRKKNSRPRGSGAENGKLPATVRDFPLLTFLSRKKSKRQKAGVLPEGSTPCRFRWLYSMMLDTTPEPTVRPPSRIAKRSPCSIAIGVISLIVIRMLSPGMTISTPSGSSIVPVTSVVRK